MVPKWRENECRYIYNSGIPFEWLDDHTLHIKADGENARFAQWSLQDIGEVVVGVKFINEIQV